MPDFDVGPDLKRLGKRRAQTVLRVAAEGQPDGIHGSLVLALYSRETNCRNIAGGARLVNGEWIPEKTDRGLAQISEKFWAAWLDSHKGCDENTYLGKYDSCLPQPRVPRLTDQTQFVCERLATNLISAQRQWDTDERFALHVAVSAYNAGAWAYIGAQNYGDPDRYTAPGPRKLNGFDKGDYGLDILDRQKRIRLWLKEQGWNL